MRSCVCFPLIQPCQLRRWMKQLEGQARAINGAMLITLKVLSKDGNEMELKVWPHAPDNRAPSTPAYSHLTQHVPPRVQCAENAPLGALMGAYNEFNPTAVRFTFDGKQLDAEQTPDEVWRPCTYHPLLNPTSSCHVMRRRLTRSVPQVGLVHEDQIDATDY